jgi:hypothetical protein
VHAPDDPRGHGRAHLPHDHDGADGDTADGEAATADEPETLEQP